MNTTENKEKIVAETLMGKWADPRGTSAKVRLYTKNGRPCAVAYDGKHKRPVFAFRFKTEEQRTARVNVFLDEMVVEKNKKDDYKNYNHTLVSGDILISIENNSENISSEWVVVETTKKFATVRCINSGNDPMIRIGTEYRNKVRQGNLMSVGFGGLTTLKRKIV